MGTPRCLTVALDPSVLGLYKSKKRAQPPGSSQAHAPHLLQEPPKLTAVGVLSSTDVTVSQKVFGIKGCRITYCKTKHSGLSCPNLLHLARHTVPRSTKALLKTKAAQKNNSSLGTPGVKPH